ncbi:hypothetical protein SDC9_142241 [bioreactor metagenome]|uniref:Uncharacterized protein n=1 Tax=bioreactor metagenome TaxID=1076179 RepID=A0A645DZX8_9ZZZZ
MERIDLNGLISDKFYGVTAGGESGNDARICRYSWILALKESCKDTGICFKFKQTGARFEKDGTVYNIPRIKQHEQARRAGIDSFPFQRKFEEYN